MFFEPLAPHHGHSTPQSHQARRSLAEAECPPALLTTTDGGKNITITSKLTVHRVEDKGFNAGIAGSRSWFLTNGARAPEDQMGEEHGQ
jgi:hypothetical protein